MQQEPLAVIGFGYVGSVTAASLAARGHRVIGIDRRAPVTEAMARGIAPIPEPGLDERLARALEKGTLELTTDPRVLSRCRASLVRVGTPVGADGQLVVDDLLAALDELARFVPRNHVCVIRITVPPGLYESARRRLARLDVGPLNPEFLREGSAVADLEAPELIVYAYFGSAATWRSSPPMR